MIDININIEKLDFLFDDFIHKLFDNNIKQSDGSNVDIIWSTQDRWVQIQKQQGSNMNFPTIIIKRDLSIKPSDEIFLFKDNRIKNELYRKINPEATKKTGKTVLDIANIKSPTYINVMYELVLFSRLVQDANTFQQLLYDDMQRTIGVIKDENMFFEIFMEGPLNESNILDFADEEKKVIVGASFRLEGFFIDNDSITITQTAPTMKISIYERGYYNKTIDEILKENINK